MSETERVMIEAIKEILPEAKQLLENNLAKWEYRDYLICIPCHFIKKKTNNTTVRFTGINKFKELLFKIKES